MFFVPAGLEQFHQKKCYKEIANFKSIIENQCKEFFYCLGCANWKQGFMNFHYVSILAIHGAANTIPDTSQTQECSWRKNRVCVRMIHDFSFSHTRGKSSHKLNHYKKNPWRFPCKSHINRAQSKKKSHGRTHLRSLADWEQLFFPPLMAGAFPCIPAQNIHDYHIASIANFGWYKNP